MNNRVFVGVALVATMAFSCVGGTVGGAVVGGLAGYTAIQSAAPVQPAIGPAQPTPLRVESKSASSSVVEAVRKTQPAVVTVVNALASQRGVTGSAQASGSGVIIDESGHVVTNNHVVEGARSLEVIFADGKHVSAQLVGTDEFSDLAIIKVDGAVPAVAPLGDSAALQPGETVIAIGSPLGDLKGTVTVGVVSAVNRDLELGPGYVMEGLIQTDAAINHGNSGGPLVNLQGQVVGINTLVVRGSGSVTFGTSNIAEGLGFAVPSDTVRIVAQQLIAQGKVARPYLGIRYQMVPLPGSDSEAQGAQVVEVVPGDPAARAGLQQDDVITALDGEGFTGQSPLVNRLMEYEPGDTVQLTVQRDGREQTLSVTLGSRPASG